MINSSLGVPHEHGNNESAINLMQIDHIIRRKNGEALEVIRAPYSRQAAQFDGLKEAE